MKIEELVSDIKLESIRHIEIRGVLGKQSMTASDDQEASTDVGGSEDSNDFDVSIDINPRSWGQNIEIWFRMTIDTSDGQLVDTVSVSYTRSTSDVIPDAVQDDFVERVAIMAAFPYLREGIQALGSRLEFDPVPVLPVLEQGQFTAQRSNEAPSEHKS